MPLETLHIFGVPIAITDYQSAMEEALNLVRRDRPGTISACNTHLVSLARHDPSFRKVLSGFDINLPDGAPLIWNLNTKGAQLKDRVYGPYFMQYVLYHAPVGTRHFFFGGSEECLALMEENIRTGRPDIFIAGCYSPPFREWTEEDEQTMAEVIHKSHADFIWVALGGNRQERWIARNLKRHSRGVFIAVGDAFELLAGKRPFAPKWMQKMGLTWLYRLAKEPRRLWSRYLRYNSLYLYYQARDLVFGARLDGQPVVKVKKPTRIAFMGTRGVPARYSGFEVVVEELGSRLAKRGYDVTVYNRLPDYHPGSHEYEGMRIVGLHTIPTKSLDTITHTFLSVLHSIGKGYHIIYLCGVGNAILVGLLKLLGCCVVLNVDGADYRRAKWGLVGSKWLQLSEYWATLLADFLIADNPEIVRRYQSSYHRKPDFISYGCNLYEEPVSCNELERWNLSPRNYILYVARLTPENAADLLIKAYRAYHGKTPLVICGSAHYETRYYKKLRELADDRVIFTDARYGDAYVELSQNAKFFVMPATIEATRVVLLDQMGFGNAILYQDCAASREVIGETGQPFTLNEGLAGFTKQIERLDTHPNICRQLGAAALERAKECFIWDRVVDQYEVLFNKCHSRPSSR